MCRVLSKASGRSSKSRAHCAGRFPVQVVVGPQVGQGMVQGGVQPRRHQGLLEPRPLRCVVVNVVGGHDGQLGLVGQRRQQSVALCVALEEVLVQLHIHRAGAVPHGVVPQQGEGRVTPARQRQPRQWAVAPASEEDEPLGVGGQVGRVQLRRTAVGGVGEREEAGLQPPLFILQNWENNYLHSVASMGKEPSVQHGLSSEWLPPSAITK